MGNKSNIMFKAVIALFLLMIAFFILLIYNNRDKLIHKEENKERSVLHYEECAIVLPEEYKQITPQDTLRGYFDSEGVLHIEFNNKRNQ